MKAKNDTSGEILNNTGTMEYQSSTGQLSINFRNMVREISCFKIVVMAQTSCVLRHMDAQGQLMPYIDVFQYYIFDWM